MYFSKLSVQQNSLETKGILSPPSGWKDLQHMLLKSDKPHAAESANGPATLADNFEMLF